MAFWDDWDFEFDWVVVGISLGVWAICGLILKMPTLMGSMDSVNIFGMPWNIAKWVLWIIALPLSYPLTLILLNRQGD